MLSGDRPRPLPGDHIRGRLSHARGGYVPDYETEEAFVEVEVDRPTILIHPLPENKRPIGFTAWTTKKKRKRKGKK